MFVFYNTNKCLGFVKLINVFLLTDMDQDEWGASHMILKEAWELIKRSDFVELGFVDESGMPNIRKTFNLKEYRSISRHFISTNTSSFHVQELLKNNRACLYYSDSNTFQGLCLYGTITVHFEREYKQFFWNEGDEIYYPKGIDDEDYCILEFQAECGQYYGGLEKHEIKREDIDDRLLEIAPFPYN